MGAEVEVGECGESLEGLLAVAGFGDGEAGADLEAAGARGGGDGLGMEEGGATEQQRYRQSCYHGELRGLVQGRAGAKPIAFRPERGDLPLRDAQGQKDNSKLLGAGGDRS